MTAKSIPSGALAGWGGVPAPVHLAHVTVGVSTTGADVVVGDIAVYNIFDLDGTVALLHAWTMVEEAFTGSVTLDFGDSASSGLISLSATIAPASTGAVLVADTGIGALPILQTNDINIDLGGATAAAGLLHVYLMYAALED